MHTFLEGNLMLRALGLLSFLLLFPSSAYADKLIMVCDDVTGRRVNFSHSEKTFDDVKDGYSNAKHIIIFDEDDPDKVSVRWQAGLPEGFSLTREFVDQFAKEKFKDELVVLRDERGVSTIFVTSKEIYTTFYNFDDQVVLTTRLVMGVMGLDGAAYYKGTCIRLN